MCSGLRTLNQWSNAYRCLGLATSEVAKLDSRPKALAKAIAYRAEQYAAEIDPSLTREVFMDILCHGGNLISSVKSMYK